ncbi:N(6)-adenine-specific methyltransferase METTL4-like isoform X1 [Montipora capricornis]|uniref:N(6)-adenine-specific methyltransferase METTL4-like isoform X1 n=1 Tax=Montipora capricornis TaxID=246305 RepID=UPI0035F1916A
MSIIGLSDNGFLVDHKKSISDSVSELSISCKSSLFALFEPYFRCSDSTSTSSGTRKRKRKKSLISAGVVHVSEEDRAAHIYHQKVRDVIEVGVHSLVKIGVDKKHFCPEVEYVEQDIMLPADQGLDLRNVKDLFGRMIFHPQDSPRLLNISGQDFVLPENCSFLLSDASNLSPLVVHAEQNGLYDLVVLDPPWYNKSAKRSSKYSFMSLWEIKSLPVPRLLAPGALVGIWVTNKQKYLRFTKSELLPHWSLELVGEWFWVKVTRRGELVTVLDSPHKKPYEPLLIGRFQPRMKVFASESLSSAMDFKKQDNCLGSDLQCNSPKRRKIEQSCDFDNTDTFFICGTDRKFSSLTPEITSTVCKSVSDLLCAECSRSKNDISKTSSTIVACQCLNHHSLNCQEMFHKTKGRASVEIRLKDNVKQNATKQIPFVGQSVRKRTCEAGMHLSLEECDRESLQNPTGKVSESVIDGCNKLPYHQVICSVPCRIHSRKPPLNEIFAKYVPPQSRCLEMFARNLTPNWTSWGNEVLKFQSVQYFDHLTSKDEGNRRVDPK